MKKTILCGLFAPLSFAAFTAHAQLKPLINFDVSLLRYGPEQGMDKNMQFKSKFLPFSAAKIGFSLGRNNVIHAGLRRQPDKFTLSSGYNPSLSVASKGFEATLGYERQLRITPFLGLLGEVGLFWDYASFTGSDFRNNAYNPLAINLKRYYIGVYPEIKVCYYLSRHISLIAGSRLRLGHVKAKQGHFAPGDTPYMPAEGFVTCFEPLSNLSFRYQL